MNLDFEECLQRQSIRPIPAEWRAEILRTSRARAAAAPWWRQWLPAGIHHGMDAASLTARRLELAAELLAACFGWPLLQWVLPASWLGHIVTFLQDSSIAVAELFFRVAGEPVLRDGLILRRPGFSIGLASSCPPCGGRDWMLALVITSLLAGYLFLRRFWSRAMLVLAVIPLAIFTTGFRVFVKGWSFIHLGPQTMTTPNSLYGSSLFFALALMSLFLLLVVLCKREGKVRAVLPSQPAAAPWWREWLWPCPRAWAGLAAAWGIIFLLHVTSPEEPARAGQVASASWLDFAFLRQETAIIAQLTDSEENRPAPPPLPAALKPRSSRRVKQSIG